MNAGIPQSLLAVQAVVLVLTTLLIAYPVVTYARNVAYTEAFVLLGCSFVLTTVVGVLDFVLGAHTVANALRPVGAFVALLGIWYFAHDFVRFDTTDRFGDFGGFVDSFGGDEDD